LRRAVILLAPSFGRLAGRGQEIRLDGANAWTVRDEKVSRVCHSTRADVLGLVDLQRKAMSDNLNLVHSIFADWERGDFSNGDWAAPEIEFLIADGPEAGSVSGVAEMARVTQGVLSSWENARAVAREFRELDDERILVLALRTGRGRASGLEGDKLRTDGAWLFRVQDRLVTRLVVYWDADRALTDLGLSEQGDPP
jgi:ketosteroid isomerase-like protein